MYTLLTQIIQIFTLGNIQISHNRLPIWAKLTSMQTQVEMIQRAAQNEPHIYEIMLKLPKRES